MKAEKEGSKVISFFCLLPQKLLQLVDFHEYNILVSLELTRNFGV